MSFSRDTTKDSDIICGLGRISERDSEGRSVDSEAFCVVFCRGWGFVSSKK